MKKYNYNYNEMCKRIVSLRKDNGLNIGDFIDGIDISFKEYQKIEDELYVDIDLLQFVVELSIKYKQSVHYLATGDKNTINYMSEPSILN